MPSERLTRSADLEPRERGATLDGSRDSAPRSIAAGAGRSSRSNNAGTLASVMINCGTLPACWNAAIASANSTSAVSGSPSDVCRRAASRARKPSKNSTRCFAHERDALVPSRERTAHVGLREGHARDPQRVGDPVGVAERPRRGDGLLGERERLVDPPGRLEPVDVRREAVAAIASVLLGDPAGELDVAIEVAAVHVAERFDERGVARLARVVAVVELELARSMCVLACRARPGRRSTRTRPRCTGGGGGERRPRPLARAAPRPRPASRRAAPRTQ